MEMGTFAIAGLGNISSRHYKAIEDIGGEIVATYDVDKSRNPTVDTFEELLESDAQWIVLLTPNKLHAAQIRQCLDAGKKVITEKPPTLSFFDLHEFDIEDEVYTISQLRYMEGIQELRKKVIKDKGYNVRLNIIAERDPIYLANWRGKKDWSGGLLYINGIHYFDILTWIFGGVKKIDYVRWFGDFKVQGRVELEQATVDFNIEIATDKPNHKSLTVNDTEIDLSAGFFELHGEIYKDMQEGSGIHVLQLSRAFELIDKIYERKN